MLMIIIETAVARRFFAADSISSSVGSSFSSSSSSLSSSSSHSESELDVVVFVVLELIPAGPTMVDFLTVASVIFADFVFLALIVVSLLLGIEVLVLKFLAFVNFVLVDVVIGSLHLYVKHEHQKLLQILIKLKKICILIE